MQNTNNPSYPTYDRGAADDLFLKNPDGSLYIGSVWPGYTVFPDWHHPKAGSFWANELSLWHEKVAYDGMWIDMGECSSFCVGSCGTDNLHLNPAHPPFALPGEPGNVDYNYPEGFSKSNASEAASASSAAASQSAAATTSSSSTQSYLRSTPTVARNINHPPLRNQQRPTRPRPRRPGHLSQRNTHRRRRRIRRPQPQRPPNPQCHLLRPAPGLPPETTLYPRPRYVRGIGKIRSTLGRRQ